MVSKVYLLIFSLVAMLVSNPLLAKNPKYEAVKKDPQVMRIEMPKTLHLLSSPQGKMLAQAIESEKFSITDDLTVDSVNGLTLPKSTNFLDFGDANLESAEQILPILMKNLGEQTPGLKMLNFESNPVGDKGLQAMAPHLNQVPALELLAFDGCGIGDEGIKDLAKHLGQIKNLEILSLSRNAITDKGIKVLAQNLKQVPNLHLLFLDGNAITDAGLDDLMANLNSVTKLHTLFLIGNNFTEEGKKRVADHPRVKSGGLKVLFNV